MKKKLALALVISLVMLVTVATPVLAAKATARGKMMSNEVGIQDPGVTTEATGQFLFYADVNVDGDTDTFTLNISIRKLDPYARCFVGYIIKRPYAEDVYHNVLRFADRHGRIKYTFQAYEDVFYSDDEFIAFIAYVETDTEHEDLLLSSGPVILFPTEPTTPI